MTATLALNRWDYSTPDTFANEVREAEAMGYGMALVGTNATRVWDPYVMLTVAALRSDSIALSTFVENAVVRHPAVIANSIASVDVVSGGRAALGIGVGDTAVRFLGLSPLRVSELEESTIAIRKLLHGDAIDFGGGRALRMDVARPVPVWVAAGGPKALRAAGRSADGVYIRVGRHPANLRAAMDAVRAGAEEAGRSMDDVRIGLVLHTVTVQDADEIRYMSRAMAAGFYEYSPQLFDTPGLRWEGPSISELKTHVWPDFHHADDLVAAGTHVDFLSEDAADAFSLFGSPRQIAGQLRDAIDALGRVDVVVPHPVPSPHTAKQFSRWFADRVWAGI